MVEVRSYGSPSNTVGVASPAWRRRVRAAAIGASLALAAPARAETWSTEPMRLSCGDGPGAPAWEGARIRVEVDGAALTSVAVEANAGRFGRGCAGATCSFALSPLMVTPCEGRDYTFAVTLLPPSPTATTPVRDAQGVVRGALALTWTPQSASSGLTLGVGLGARGPSGGVSSQTPNPTPNPTQPPPPPPLAPVTLAILRPQAPAGMATSTMNEVLTRFAAQLRYCGERQRLHGWGGVGRLEVAWQMQPDGTATEPAAVVDTLGAAAVTTCVLSRFSRMQFLETPAGGKASVTLEFGLAEAEAAGPSAPAR